MDFYDLVNEINKTIRIRDEFKEELMDKIIPLLDEVDIIKLNCDGCGEELILIKKEIDDLLINYGCYGYSTQIINFIDEYLNSKV